jgi:hypothetical protein
MNIEQIEKPIVVSFSGGRTSAYMAKYLLDKYSEKNFILIFANTGKERDETLDFINDCDLIWKFNTIWLEADISSKKGYWGTFKEVNYKKASRNGEPFEKMIKKYGLPNLKNPHCTRDLKLTVIKKYLQSIGLNSNKDYYTAIGIRADESHRINWQKAKENNYIYPLAVEHRVNSDFIRKFWLNQDFDLKLKDYEGNCDMCWKKSKRKLLTLITENPNLIKWWNDMEVKYGGKKGYSFYRNNETAKDLIDQSKLPFRKSIDLQTLDSMQTKLFKDFETGMDSGLNCLCNID